MQRQTSKSYTDAMTLYESILDKLVEVNGDGKSYRQGEDLQSKVREGEVVAIRCPDNDFYYRTSFLRRNQLTGKLEKHISNQILGQTP